MVTKAKITIGSKRERGFSLVETLMVCAIAVVIAALALPATAGMIASARLRSNVSALAGFIQNCRSAAVRTNQPMRVSYTTLPLNTLVYIKDATSTGQPASTDPQFLIDQGINLTRDLPTDTGVVPLDTSSIWAAGQTPLHTDVSFNARGLPCNWNGTQCQAGVGFVYYFSYYPRIAAPQWIALSISPAGRVALWYWTGSVWKG